MNKKLLTEADIRTKRRVRCVRVSLQAKPWNSLLSHRPMKMSTNYTSIGELYDKQAPLPVFDIPFTTAGLAGRLDRRSRIAL